MDLVFVQERKRSSVTVDKSLNDSMNDRWEQMLRLESSQPFLIRVQLCIKRADFHHITGTFEWNDVGVLKLKVSPKFVLMKQAVLNVYSTQRTTSSSRSNINERFWIAKILKWMINDYQVLCAVVFLMHL